MSCKLRCYLYSEEECKTVCRYARQLAEEIGLAKELQVSYGLLLATDQVEGCDSLN